MTSGARGRTVVAAIFDEVAHWRNEASANPDEDVYSASASDFDDTQCMMIGISPYAGEDCCGAG